MGRSKSSRLHDEAQKRAEEMRQQRIPSYSLKDHPLLDRPTAGQKISLNTPIDPVSARKEWKRHGEGLSQASEEKRRPQMSTDIVVRIIAAETRKDIS